MKAKTARESSRNVDGSRVYHGVPSQTIDHGKDWTGQRLQPDKVKVLGLRDKSRQKQVRRSVQLAPASTTEKDAAPPDGHRPSESGPGHRDGS